MDVYEHEHACVCIFVDAAWRGISLLYKNPNQSSEKIEQSVIYHHQWKKENIYQTMDSIHTYNRNKNVVILVQVSDRFKLTDSSHS